MTSEPVRKRQRVSDETCAVLQRTRSFSCNRANKTLKWRKTYYCDSRDDSCLFFRIPLFCEFEAFFFSEKLTGWIKCNRNWDKQTRRLIFWCLTFRFANGFVLLDILQDIHEENFAQFVIFQRITLVLVVDNHIVQFHVVEHTN